MDKGLFYIAHLPWPPNISYAHIFWIVPATENTFLSIIDFGIITKFQILFTFDKIDNPLYLLYGTTSQRPKVVRTPDIFNILISKCILYHNDVYFFDVLTSKSNPNMVYFVNFNLEMCFAPQRCAFFRHLNFQKWSDAVVFCTFWFRNVPHGVYFFDILTSKSDVIIIYFVYFNFERYFVPQ